MLLTLLEISFPDSVICAAEGKEALSLLEKNNVEFVLTDINMPNGMGGLELLKNIKEKYPNIKSIAMSGYLRNFDNGEIKSLSYHVFEKPVKIKELLKLINEANTKAS